MSLDDRGNPPRGQGSGTQEVVRRLDGQLAKRPEPGANLFDKQLWLLPRSEVPAPVEPVEMDELGIRLLGPAPRGWIELVRKDAHGNRDGDVLDVEKAELVLPVEAGRGNARVRQPKERDVVEHVVSREALRLSVEDPRDELEAARIVVEDPCGQADR